MFGIDDAMTALAVANLASGVLQSGSASKAGGQQAAAFGQAAQLGQGMFNTVSGNQAPFVQGGQNALSTLLGGLGVQAPYVTPQNFNASAYLAANPDVAADPFYGKNPYQHYLDFGQKEIASGNPNRTLGFNPNAAAATAAGIQPGQLTRSFTNADLTANLAPNYQFNLDWGLRGVQNQSNSLNSLLSGNTGKGLVDYATNYAQNAYQNAFNNFQAQQTNIYNRLATISGLGQTAGSAAATGAPQFASAIGGNIANVGAAQAAGTVGSMNALTGGVTNAASMFALPSILRGPGATTPGGGIDPSMFAG